MWKLLAVCLALGILGTSRAVPVEIVEHVLDPDHENGPEGQSGCSIGSDVAECEDSPGDDNLDSERNVQSGEVEPAAAQAFKPVCDEANRVYSSPEFYSVASKALGATKKVDCPEVNVTKPPEVEPAQGQTLSLLFRPLFCYNFVCNSVINWVCGSDGVSYYNECQLRLTACSYPYRRLTIWHYGRCRPHRIGLAISPLPCETPCPKILAPVCGSNDKTYSNQCELENAKKCLPLPSLTVKHLGYCKRPWCRPCPWYVSPFFAVCGTDGRTYASRCHLERAACMNPQLGLAVKHSRPCRRGHAAAANDCDFKCNDDSAPACGTDGVTYRNPCQLYKAACERQHRNLKMDHLGSCYNGQGADLCPDTCSRKKDPVCGNDGTSYQNLCLLKLQACQTKNTTLAVASNGLCDKDASVCSWECPGVVANVCGLDRQNVFTRRTYTNRCYLYKDSCDRNDETLDITDGYCSPEDEARDSHQRRSTCLATSSRNGKTVECKFPFVHNRIVYHGCSRAGREFSWCATAVNSKREVTAWGLCQDLCQTCDCRDCRCGKRRCPINCPEETDPAVEPVGPVPRVVPVA